MPRGDFARLSMGRWWLGGGYQAASMHVQAHLPVAEPPGVVVPLELVRLSGRV